DLREPPGGAAAADPPPPRQDRGESRGFPDLREGPEAAPDAHHAPAGASPASRTAAVRHGDGGRWNECGSVRVWECGSGEAWSVRAWTVGAERRRYRDPD